MKPCHCNACRARDERRFWRIIEPLRPASRLNLPPVPTWEGEPPELTLLPRDAEGGQLAR